MSFNPEKEFPNMSVIENEYDKLCDFQWLYDSYREARKGKRYEEETMSFSNNLAGHLLDLRNDMRNETYETSPYHRFFVHEPKLRLVMSIPFRDRVAQWAIYRILNPFYDKLFIDDSYACRVGKGKDAAVAKLKYWMEKLARKPGKWYVLKLDISKYFYRIDHAKLLEILNKRIKDERLFRLLEKIINCPHENFGLPPGRKPEDTPVEEWLPDKGMPIGNLTSQLFANIYLNEMDQYIKHVLKMDFDMRYMDDNLIILDDLERLKEIQAQIETFLKDELLLDTNDKTTIRPISQGIEFCGQRIYADHSKLKKKTANRMKHGVKALSSGLADGTVPREYFDRVCASYNGLLVHCDSYGLRRKLNYIYLRETKAGEPKMDKIEIIRRLFAHIVDLEMIIRGVSRKSLLEIEGEIDLTRIECAKYAECDDDELNLLRAMKIAKKRTQGSEDDGSNVGVSAGDSCGDNGTRSYLQAGIECCEMVPGAEQTV